MDFNAGMVKEEDGCFFLDALTEEEIRDRMDQAASTIEEEIRVIRGCRVRLGI